MNAPASLNPPDIESLLSDRVIGDEHPWSTADLDVIESHYRFVCAAIERICEVQSRIEWDHYGSGYASYVDAWFYRPEPGFAVERPADYEYEHIGLVVLLSRNSPFYALAEGAKGWSKGRGYSYMPALEDIDRLTTPSVQGLAQQCAPVLETYGLMRVTSDQLALPLPAGTKVITNLSDRKYTIFDALFRWDD